MNTDHTIHCPIKGPLPAPTCPPAELAPLLEALEANQPVSEPRRFPRGTLLPDGRLDLCKQGLGADGCRAVTGALAGNTFVRSLLLGTNGIGDAGARDVAKLLAANRALEVVYLGCNGIGAAGAESLSAAVAQHPTVCGLWLKRNPIGPNGLKAVAELVRSGAPVRTLDLVNTCPGEPALRAVMEAATDARSAVEALYLGGNALGPDWGTSLATLVGGTRTLKGLFLSVNCLGDAGAVGLASGLVQNRSLNALSLASNDIGPTGVAAVTRSLCGHPELAWLDLGYSPSTRVLGCAANRGTGEAISALAELITNAPQLTELNLAQTGISPTELCQLAGAIEHSPNLVNLTYTGPRVAPLDELLAKRRADRGWRPPDRPDIALIRSVYR